MTIPTKELGCAGHFVGAKDCLWRRHTQVGGAFRVSTIGLYYPASRGTDPRNGDDPESFKFDSVSYFESMVFRTATCPSVNETHGAGCGCHPVKDYGGCLTRRYATAGEANAGHDELVARFARRVEVHEAKRGKKQEAQQ